MWSQYCRSLLLVGVFVLCLPPGSHAQPWSGILDPARAVDWSLAGVEGGIPTTRTQCGSTLAAGASAATINAAIQACGANQFVKLGAGTFTLSVGLTFTGKNNVTLRGSGADQTILNFQNTDGCLGLQARICIAPSGLSYYADSSGTQPAHVANWTSGYAKGSTSIVVSATTGLAVNQIIILDQLNDTNNQEACTLGPGCDLYVCSTAGTCVEQGSTINGRVGRGQRQYVRVTNIAGTTLTITPGVYMPNISSGKSPSAWWGNTGAMIVGDGVEDLTVDATNSGPNTTNIALGFSENCWVKGVRSINAPSPKNHVWLYASFHSTVRDSYFYGSQGDAGASTNYGVDPYGVSQVLIENNIFQHRTSPIVSNGDQGSVYGYNFSIDDHYTASPPWMQADLYSHEIGNAYLLREGNSCIGIKGDTIHGTSNLLTHFRNYCRGWEVNKTAQTSPVILHTNMRFWAFIGNVLGTAAYHTVYESGAETSIWRLNVSYGGIPSDNVTVPSLLRWGNWDSVTSTNDTSSNDTTGIRFVAGEVPSGIASYPNAVPATQALPPSFYLAAKPAWFAAVPWPPIGPDVTGGDIANVGGHAYKNPAQLCYEAASPDLNYPTNDTGTRPIHFDPATCYAAAVQSSPAPTILRVIR